MNCVTFNYAGVYVFYLVTPSIPQSQFSEKGFKKTVNVRHNLVLLLFLFTVEI